MHFIITGTFASPRAEDLVPVRAAHLEYMMTALPFTRVGGARLSDEQGSSLLGLMVVVDLPDRAAAEHFIANEPYRKAGLITTVEIEPLRIMMEEHILRSELDRERARGSNEAV